jgi:hypothetical protein
MQTDTQTGMKQLPATFHNFANTHKNYVNEIIQVAVTEQRCYLHMKNIPIRMISQKLFISQMN